VQRRILVARRSLVDSTLHPAEPALLLEGAWPAGSPAWHESLDECVDARFEWIDLQAVHWVEQLGRPAHLASNGNGKALLDEITAGYLNARSLRYALAKLLRVVAYLTEIRPIQQDEQLEFFAARGRDEDYADLLAELARAAGAVLRVHWRDRQPRPEPGLPGNGHLRRWLGRLLGALGPSPKGHGPGERIVLCGNPRILDPLCAELVTRACRVWWLYDRFAIRAWLRWRVAGVGQLVCNSSEGRRNLLASRLPERLSCRQVDLVPAVGRWLAERMRTHGRMQTRMIEAIDAHFRRVRPSALVVCEDATPFARAAIAVARRHGAASLVVQHGTTTCRFGFAPLAADRFLAWGEASQRQLTAWGVPPERIEITGSPQHDAWVKRFVRDVAQVAANRLPKGDCPDFHATGDCPNFCEEEMGLSPSITQGTPDAAKTKPALARTILGLPRLGRRFVRRAGGLPGDSDHRGRRFLVLGTVPPEDGRPDSIALHLTRRTYESMWESVFAAAERRPGARLLLRPHPRSNGDPVFRAVRRSHPAVPVELVRRGALTDLTTGVDVVLSFLSTAGIELAQVGAPVIQILPPGSGDVLPHAWWGLVGSARNSAELEDLLDFVLAGQWTPPDPTDGRVLDNFRRPAAARVADAVLRAAGPCESTKRHIPLQAAAAAVGWDEVPPR